MTERSSKISAADRTIALANLRCSRHPSAVKFGDWTEAPQAALTGFTRKIRGIRRPTGGRGCPLDSPWGASEAGSVREPARRHKSQVQDVSLFCTDAIIPINYCGLMKNQ
jgi:hypothetical protein